MKKFLITCIIAMISAGIYGFIDMSRDIHNGTMINYEGQQTPKVKAYTRARTQAQANNTIREKLAVVEEEKKKLEKTNKLKVVNTEMKMSYFSRGEEIYEPVTDLTAGTDASLTSAKVDTVKVSTKVSEDPNKKKEEVKDTASTAAIIKENPTLNVRMFSRGGFSSYKKTTIAQNDSKSKK